MKDNRDILNEAFFKKSTYEEIQKSKLPQYAPVDAKQAKQGSSIVPGVDAYQITDTAEMKRRLANTFGATFGGNNVKSMASKAIKTFPIIVSDNVEPETVVMLKKLMEEQYAEYINLLISNQVIDLADYRANEGDGNIAIQALDKLSGTEFGISKVADKAARTGAVSADDIFSTLPLYTLLRENNLVIDTGDTLTNKLLEGALIVPEDKADELAEFVLNYSNDIVKLNETGEISARIPSYGQHIYNKYSGKEDWDDFDNHANDILTRDTNVELKRGYVGSDENGNDYFSKLSTADVVFDEKMLDHCINRSVGDLLTDKSNVAIRDKFEKATYLLQSRRISGMEYYQYLTLRLGIPVSDKTRAELMRRYKVGDIRDYSGHGKKVGSRGNRDYLISDKKANNITHSREIDGIVEPILRVKIKDVLIGLGITVSGGIAGGITGLTIGSVTGHTGWKEFFTGMMPKAASSASGFGEGLAASAFIWGPIAGAAIGAGSFLLLRALRRRRQRKLALTQLEGWERVERLILIMENRQAEVIKMHNEKEMSDKVAELARQTEFERLQKIVKDNGYNNKEIEWEINGILDDTSSMENYNKAIAEVHGRVTKLAESVTPSTDKLTFNEMKWESFDMDEELASLTEEAFADKELKAEILAERAVRTTMPMQVKYVEKKPGADVLYAPANFTRTSYAYGSTEIERKDNKDRRFNQPLIMKVKFKERYDDGKFSDSELTAVIGILGKVIRIPSEEMQYILTENTKGRTLEGIISGGINNTITDLLSSSKISNDLKKLPQSGDIWHNLEKVATLAAANSITGRRNNNIANAHIVFSQKEIDACRIDTGVDYLKDGKKSAALMKRYSAFTLMVANDAGQRAYIFDDQDSISWNVLPYSALAGKDNGEQLAAALNKLGRL
jgi:hypothetical protein